MKETTLKKILCAPYVNWSSNYFEDSMTLIQKAYDSSEITYDKLLYLQSIAFLRTLTGYVFIFFKGVFAIVYSIVAQIIVQLSAFIIPKKYNILYKFHKFIIYKLSKNEKFILKNEYEVGFITQKEYDDRVTMLDEIDRKTIDPIYDK